MPDDRRPVSEPTEPQTAQKWAVPRCIGRTQGGLLSKLHAVCEDTGNPVRLLLTEGQTSDDTGARRLLPSLPTAKHMIADPGYDADWLITAVKKQGLIFYFKGGILSPGSPSDSGSLIQLRYTWLGSASPRFYNHSLLSNCEQTAVC
ncbi:MAG: transposase [Nitrospira sp.]